MANNILKGKRGIIFGALDSKSIAWKVAEHAHAEGAKFVLTNAPIALRMGTINELAEKTGSKVISADATSMEDLKANYLSVEVLPDIKIKDQQETSLDYFKKSNIYNHLKNDYDIIKNKGYSFLLKNRFF